MSGMTGERLRKIIIAPTTLQDTAQIEYIEATAAAGYDGIGLRVHRSPGLPFHPVVGNTGLIREMKSRIADAGLAVFDLYSFYLQPDTDVASFAPAMELGAAFGAKYATVMGADEDWSRQRDNFVKTCDLAAQFALTCSLEFAVIRPLATLPQTVQLIEEAKRDGREAALKRGKLPTLGEPMRFDHRRILATAIARLRAKLKYRPVVFELMPAEFTLTQLQHTVEAISGRLVHKQNFRRLVESAALVEPTGETSTETGGRPAALFRFRREVLAERPAPGLRVGGRS